MDRASGFYRQKNMRGHLTLPTSLQALGMNAFWNCSLEGDLILPHNLTVIGNMPPFGIFSNNNNITLLDMSQCEITKIPDYSFCETFSNEGTIILGPKINYIGMSAFQGNYLSGSQLTIPGSVYTIGINAFASCNIKKLSLPSNLTTIDDYAFQNNPIEDVEITDGGMYKKLEAGKNGYVITNTTISKPSGGLAYGDIDLSDHNEITAIDDDAFVGCLGVTSLILPTNCISIGKNAFVGCNITSIEFGAGLTTLDSTAFFYDNSITSITFNWLGGEIPSTGIGQNWLTNTNADKSNITVYVPIGQKQEYINHQDYLDIKGCNIVEKNQKVDCSSWISNSTGDLTVAPGIDATHVNIEQVDNIVAIDPTINSQIAFNKSTYTIDGLKEGLFAGQMGLEGTVTIDSSITSINSNVFNYCDKITSFKLQWDKDNLPSISNTWLGNLNRASTNIIVDPKDLNEYVKNRTSLGINECNIYSTIDASLLIKDAKGTIDITTDENETNPVVKILNMNLTEAITNPIIDTSSFITVTGYKLNTIQESLFKDNDKLQGKLTITSSITSIEANAFANCQSLTSLSIPIETTTIGSNAFDQCISLNKVYLFWNSDQETTLKASLASDWLGNLNTNTTTLYIPYESGSWFIKMKNEGSLGISECTIRTSEEPLIASNWITNATSGSIVIEPTEDPTIYKIVKIINQIKCENPIINDKITISDIKNTEYNIDGLNDELFKNQTELTGAVTINRTIGSNENNKIGFNIFNGCNGITEIRLNWTEDDINEIIEHNLINKNWLQYLNKESFTIVVPKGKVDLYKTNAEVLGISNCNITDNEPIPPGPGPEPTPSNNLTLILGISLGIGIPILTGIIIGTVIGIKKHNKHIKRSKKR